jgi:hypothetical protein
MIAVAIDLESRFQGQRLNGKLRGSPRIDFASRQQLSDGSVKDTVELGIRP